GLVYLLAIAVEVLSRRRAFQKLGVLRGYKEYLYTTAQKAASSCWCKEKSSTVGVKKTSGGKGIEGDCASRRRWYAVGPAD
ncbi:MAG TPA: hypothetical protein VN788_06055, partial [Verrucomicrobiae bacterium]|nr:hypothetical protein [Verrucomicrobiae bacterium]